MLPAAANRSMRLSLWPHSVLFNAVSTPLRLQILILCSVSGVGCSNGVLRLPVAIAKCHLSRFWGTLGVATGWVDIGAMSPQLVNTQASSSKPLCKLCQMLALCFENITDIVELKSADILKISLQKVKTFGSRRIKKFGLRRVKKLGLQKIKKFGSRKVKKRGSRRVIKTATLEQFSGGG